MYSQKEQAPLNTQTGPMETVRTLHPPSISGASPQKSIADLPLYCCGKVLCDAFKNPDTFIVTNGWYMPIGGVYIIDYKRAPKGCVSKYRITCEPIFEEARND